MSAPVTAVRLPPNPVWRSYLGGSVLRQFRALPGTADDHFPEDWLASTVLARNGSHATHPQEGLSLVTRRGSPQPLAEALRAEPEFWLGRSGVSRAGGAGLGVLWKLLDSSVRLQFQAHPSAAFARAHLKSNAGKTECWYILAAREAGHVYLGFQRPPSRAAWASMIREQRVGDMMACFDRVPVQPGDCYVVPAGTPHAIGPGIFMVELMEPTDWVVRCETVNAGLVLPPEACFMGLGLEACLDIFDYAAYSVEDVRKTFQQHPRVMHSTGSTTEEEIIGPQWHNFFRLHRLRGSGDAAWAGHELLLAIILRGRGHLRAGGQAREAGAGETWLLPGAAESWEWSAGGDWEILMLKLPVAPEK